MRRACRWMTWLVVGGALVAVVVSLSAGLLGVDTDQKWGPFRTGLLAAGAGVLGLVACLRLVDGLDRRLAARRRGSTRARAEGSTAALGERPRVGAPTKWLGLVGFLVAMELLYVWFVSVGHWTAWPRTTDYYNMLADAFLQGQTALLVEPPQELASLEYPWPTAMRPGIPVVADASYFRGKYYMYWGPAPAGMAAVWKVTTGQRVGDEHLVFVAATVILVFSVLIVLDLRRASYPEMPPWLLGCTLLAVTTVHPLLWNLNRPAIHEAAISSAQAFLLAGLYFALPTIQGRETRAGRLALAGTLWALALASRLVLLGAVGALAVVTLWGWARARRGDGARRREARGLIGLALPIVAGLGLLGVYNSVRFGNPFETGVRYQLGVIDLNRLADTGFLFNVAYLPANTLYYLLAPLRFRFAFPFVRPVFGDLPSIAAFLRRFDQPTTHYVEDVTGLFMVIPFVLAAAVCAATVLCQWPPAIPHKSGGIPPSANTRGSGDLIRLAGVLFAASFLAFAPAVLFFWVATRYMLDFTPLLLLAASISTWAAIRAASNYPVRRGMLSTFIVGALLSTVCVSLLLAVTGSDSRFDDMNPALWGQLLSLFSP